MDEETFKLLFLTQLYKMDVDFGDNIHIKAMKNRFWTSFERRGASGGAIRNCQMKKIESAFSYMKELGNLTQSLVNPSFHADE